MLRFTSKPDKFASALILAALELPAMAVLLISLYNSASLMLTVLPGVLLIAGMGLYLALRLQFTEFTYEITEGGSAGSFDLNISSRCGRRLREECRVRVDGTLLSYKKRGSRVFRCCPLFADGSKMYFYAGELPEGQCLLLRADVPFYNKMKLLGCSDED